MYSLRGVRVLLALMVGLVLAVPASARPPVRLVFDRAEATPHTLVSAKTARKRTLLRFRKRDLRAYFRADPLVPLGRLSVNRKGNGTLHVNVPNVPARDYPVVLKGLPGSPRLRVVASFRVIEGPALRPCRQSVWGDLGDDWLARAHNVGPIHMMGYDPTEASEPSWRSLALDRVTGQYAVKVLLIIDRGPAVTLAVATEDQKLVALSYIPRRFNLHRVVDQDATVTFEPCSGNESSPPWATEPVTQFNGGFVFVRPLCAHLTLTVAGRKPFLFALPLGKAC